MQICKICDNISDKKYEKLPYCIFKMKGVESNCLWKKALYFNIGAPLFGKKAHG